MVRLEKRVTGAADREAQDRMEARDPRDDRIGMMTVIEDSRNGSRGYISKMKIKLRK